MAGWIMIAGVVTADREAIIPVNILGMAGQIQGVDAVIDTGFDGSLSLPPALIAQLGLAWQHVGRALLADGSESIFNIYEATVLWDGLHRDVLVHEADTMPLVGMALLDGFELSIRVRPSGQVAIRQLP